MASMRDIKRRKGSIQSTQQITKAMKLVSTVKLQRAKTRADAAKEYFNCMYDTIHSMLEKTGNSSSPYLVKNESKKCAVVVITSNRGLAGGYNSNIVKLVASSDIPKEDAYIYAIGKKGKDGLARFGYEIKADDSDMIDEPQYPDAKKLCEELLAEYTAGNIGEIYIAYTKFKNTVTHIPTLTKLLPIDTSSEDKKSDAVKTSEAIMNYDPEDDEALELIIPKYVASMIYGGLLEASASENGARMQAMDSATSNAEEMIDKLSLQYNRARQSSITQELTEIVAGAEAIN